jgi:dCTP deaminase
MILKADEIRRRMDNKGRDPLVITPRPSSDALKDGTAAVDLRLGTWFMALRPARMPALEIGAANEARATKTHYVKFGDRYYLHPHTFALGVTLEWLRLPRTLAGYVVGKSSWGRRGLIIATAVGVHPGFTGCLTLELANTGEMPIAIEPGMRICQLFLHTTVGDEDSLDQSALSRRRKPALGTVSRDSFCEDLRTRSLVAPVRCPSAGAQFDWQGGPGAERRDSRACVQTACSLLT